MGENIKFNCEFCKDKGTYKDKDPNNPGYVGILECPCRKRKILPGKYQHWKGDEYWVYGTGIHTETGEATVVYRKLHGIHASEKNYDEDFFVRPFAAFVGIVIRDQYSGPRFKQIQKLPGQI